jgi:hypothetical protein
MKSELLTWTVFGFGSHDIPFIFQCGTSLETTVGGIAWLVRLMPFLMRGVM